MQTSAQVRERPLAEAGSRCSGEQRFKWPHPLHNGHRESQCSMPALAEQRAVMAGRRDLEADRVAFAQGPTGAEAMETLRGGP